jgi:hypothetical protein
MWLCYHYLESSKSDTDDYDIGTSTGNPFCDPERPGNAPALVHLTPEEAAKENVDTEEEGRIRVRLIEQRRQILRAQRAKGLEPGIFGPKEHNRTVGEEDGTSEVTSRRKAGLMNPKPGSPRDISSPQEGSTESTASDSQSSLPRMSHESIIEREPYFNHSIHPFSLVRSCSSELISCTLSSPFSLSRSSATFMAP